MAVSFRSRVHGSDGASISGCVELRRAAFSKQDPVRPVHLRDNTEMVTRWLSNGMGGGAKRRQLCHAERPLERQDVLLVGARLAWIEDEWPRRRRTG